MKKSRRFHPKKREQERYRINEKILALELQVIDENGNMMGSMETAKALEMAKERGFDLVEVSPKADPPVAKFLDYGRFQYVQEKQKRKAKVKQKKTELKGIRISPRISEHDLELRVNRANKFLEEGNKVKIEMNLRGREHRHTDLAKEKIQEFIDKLGEEVTLEQAIAKAGGTLSAIVYKKQK